MFSLKIPTRRTPAAIAQVTNLIPYRGEMLTRDAIIKQMAKECPYKVGDHVRPVNDKDYEKEGLYRVDRIFADWKEYSGRLEWKEVDWPKNNNPLIVQALNTRDHKWINATTNYFKKAETV